MTRRRRAALPSARSRTQYTRRRPRLLASPTCARPRRRPQHRRRLRRRPRHRQTLLRRLLPHRRQRLHQLLYSARAYSRPAARRRRSWSKTSIRSRARLLANGHLLCCTLRSCCCCAPACLDVSIWPAWSAIVRCRSPVRIEMACQIDLLSAASLLPSHARFLTPLLDFVALVALRLALACLCFCLLSALGFHAPCPRTLAHLPSSHLRRESLILPESLIFLHLASPQS